MSNRLLLIVFAAVALTLPLFLTHPSMAQPSPSDKISPGEVITGNFSLVYDFSDFAGCIPDCIDITILYDSSNNQLTYINHREIPDVANITHIDDEQEKILAESVPHLRYLNFTDNTCKLHQPYCLASRLTVTSDLNIGSGNHTTTSEWSFLTSDMVSNANKIAGILYKSAGPFISIAMNQTNADNMTSMR